MADLRDHFALADRLDVPELWGRAAALAEETPGRRGRIPDPRGDRSRIVAAVVAILVFAAAGAFVWDAFSGSDGAPAIEPGPTVDPWSALSPGLNELPPPPSARYGAATVWTGDRLVVWGGARNDGATSFDDGFAFDPSSERWTALPAAPLDARYFPVAVWTGREALIWGGWHDDNHFVSDGAAYDPATATWRLLADAPIPFARSVGAWTGNEMLVWDPEAKVAAAYDPSIDTWRLLPDSPIALERVDGSLWTGADIVVGGLFTTGPSSNYDGRVLAFDPSSDRWRELPQPELDGNAMTLVWTGSDVIGIDLDHVARSYRPGADRWTNLPAIPLNAGEFSPQAAFAGGDLFVDTFSGQAVLNLATRTWNSVPAVRPPDGYLTPITAGSAIVLWQGAPTTPAPHHLFVWKPRTEPSQMPSADQAVDVARIVCTSDSIRIQDPVVRAQRDGVDLRFEDPGQWSEYSLHPESSAYGQSEGANLSKDGSTIVTHALPPGDVTVACVHARGSYFDADAVTGLLTVVDPAGLFVPWDLECGAGEQFKAQVPGTQDERVDDVFRRLRGVLASDELASPAYPKSPLIWPTRIVFRDGQVIARIMAPNASDGAWQLLVNACPDSGIEKTP